MDRIEPLDHRARHQSGTHHHGAVLLSALVVLEIFVVLDRAVGVALVLDGIDAIGSPFHLGTQSVAFQLQLQYLARSAIVGFVGNIVEDVLPIYALIEVLDNLPEHMAADLELAIAGVAECAGASHSHPARLFPFLQRHMESGQESHCPGLVFRQSDDSQR